VIPLIPVSWLYGLAAERRRARLSARGVRLPVPVLSVGNITCGGTGKTPTVEMIVRDLIARGRHPAILSRGYRAGADGRNDEWRVLSKALPEVPHIADPDRARGGRAAISAGADVLVLDDGFQHVRLARDLDLVLIDALDPFGGGRVLPAGLLREPLRALRSAHLIAITRGRLVPPPLLGVLRGLLRDRFPGVPRIELDAEPISWAPLPGGAPVAPGELRGKRVAAFAGIGNPAAFRAELAGLGLEVVSWTAFPDHHPYRPEELAEIGERARRAGAEAVVMTEKDAVKIPPAFADRLPWLSLRIAFRVTAGADTLDGAIRRAIGSAGGVTA
jgi:tetraacyldisaccharide 4'-kinase